MASIDTIPIAVTTTGSNGSAAGSTTSDTILGFLIDVYFDFHASAPSGTDTTVAYATRGGTLIALTDTATDALHMPRKQTSDSAGAAISGAYEPYLLNDRVTVSVTGSNALTNCVVAYLRVLRP